MKRKSVMQQSAGKVWVDRKVYLWIRVITNDVSDSY
jgi:hypothetical protein